MIIVDLDLSDWTEFEDIETPIRVIRIYIQ